MKIAYFSDTFYPQINGVSNTLSYLKKYLDQHGVEYRFYIPDYEDAAQSDDPRLIRSRGVPLPIYSDCRLTLPWLPRLNSLMDAFQPDLIHLATEFGIGVMGRYYARSKQIPIVSSYHTNIDQYTRYYPSLTPLKGNVKEYFKWFHRRSRRIFVPTDETRKHLQSEGYANLSIWSRGIDTALFSPTRRSEEFRRAHGLTGKTVVLYVGRVAAEKDIDILPSVIRTVQARHRDVVFVVTGDGPYLPALKAEAPEDTVFTGFLRGEELARAYASSDLFLTPSSTETFGNVALEAMASGLPVGAADAGGFRNIVRHGEDGLLAAPRDECLFADALCRLIGNPETAAAMGQRAIETANKRSWDGIFERLLDDYGQAVGRGLAAS
ncbi:MAG: glycosyltransferase family 1 protein [Clostridiales bacterium]|nr:glycosyltransferase family 1 protein [Clostridiales bacterium]